MRVVFTRTASKSIVGLPASVRDTLKVRLAEIAADPFASHRNVRPLAGRASAFRIRMGNWRALYEIDRSALTLTVYIVDHRSRAYR